MKEIAKNQRAVDAQKATRRDSIAISGVKGLRLELYPSGRRTWSLRYQVGRGRVNRKMSTISIGDADQITVAAAAERAQQIIAQAQLSGRDEAEERRSEAAAELSLDDVFEAWLERYARRKTRSWPEEQRRWATDVSPSIGKIAASQVTRAQVSALRDDVMARAPVVANRLVTLINRVLNWAVDAGLLQVNVAARLRRMGTEGETRGGRHLSIAEVDRLVAHLKEAGGVPRRRDLLTIIALTGQRRNEVAHMRRSELRDTGEMIIWSLPEQRRHAKKGGAHVVPLVGLAADIVRERLKVHTGEYVFGSGKKIPNPRSISRAACDVGRELFGRNLGPHDLRRSCATGMAALGIANEVRERVLGHTPQSVEGAHYNRHDYLMEKADALTRWGLAVSASRISLAPRSADA